MKAFIFLVQYKYIISTGIIYVLDSSDETRVNEAKDELQKLAAEKELKKCFFLILANKQVIIV